MVRCPICKNPLSPFGKHPYAPICSEACRREALRRAGISEEGPEEGPPSQFEKLNATSLFCPNCRRSMPTREKLLLTLPDGDLYGYSCAQCGADVGSRTEKN